MTKVGKIFRETLISGIKEEVQNNNTTFILSYSAVSSSKMDSLRKNLKKIGAKVYVSKNRIAQLALKELKHEKLAEHIDGQTAFVWTSSDAVTVSKSLIDFIKKAEGIVVQGGLLDGAVLGKEDVKRLSDLPSKDVLRSQLLQVMLAPLTRLAGSLNAKSRDLLSILKQLSEKKRG